MSKDGAPGPEDPGPIVRIEGQGTCKAACARAWRASWASRTPLQGVGERRSPRRRGRASSRSRGVSLRMAFFECKARF